MNVAIAVAASCCISRRVAFCCNSRLKKLRFGASRNGHAFVDSRGLHTKPLMVLPSTARVLRTTHRRRKPWPRASERAGWLCSERMGAMVRVAACGPASTTRPPPPCPPRPVTIGFATYLLCCYARGRQATNETLSNQSFCFPSPACHVRSPSVL